MLSSLISTVSRHVILLLLSYTALKLIPSLLSWLPRTNEPNPDAQEPWTLDYKDVREARTLLKALGLPMELALDILDYAEYWPSRTFSSNDSHSSNDGSNSNRTVKVEATLLRPSTALLLPLSLNPFHAPCTTSLRTHGEHPRVKALLFRIRSRDQGWTSEPTRGTFNTSSWLEVSILRGLEDTTTRLPPSCSLADVFAFPAAFETHIAPRGWRLVQRPEEAEQGPQGGEDARAWYLQGNRVATQGRGEVYEVRWTRDGWEGNEGGGRGEGFVEALEEGDRVVVWARAKWPGWQCVVERVDVTVYYGFS